MSDPRAWNEAPSVRAGPQRVTNAHAARAPSVSLTRFGFRAVHPQGPEGAYQLSLAQPAGLGETSGAPAGGADGGGWASAPLGGDGCFASITRTAKDAGEFVSTTALPTLTARLAGSRAWLSDNLAPSVQSGLAYAREVAMPAAVDSANRAQTFLSETALPYTRTVLLPALADGYVYARDVALPAVARSWSEGGAAHRARAEAAASGAAAGGASSSTSGGAAAEDGHTVKPEHGVPAMAGHDEVLPHGGGAAPIASDGKNYSSISNVVSAAVAPAKEQKAPLLHDVPVSVHDIDKPPTEFR
jgi:hypothetical protein